MLYAYKARKNSGELISGTLEAVSEQEVMKQLGQRQLFPVNIKQASKQQAAVSETPKTAEVKSGRVDVRDIMVFCINLSNMVGAGIPLLGALNVIGKQMNNPYLGSVVINVSRSVSEGSAFSEALGKYPDVFSRLFVNMVRLGETSGTMEKVLKTLAIYMEQQENLRQKIHGALIYPALLMVAGTGVIGLILTFVMPKFVGIFQKSGVELPAATQIMYVTGTWLQHFWFIPLGGLIGITVLVKKTLRTKAGRNIFDRVLLKMPLFGPLTAEILVARFCRTLGTLMEHGVPMLRSLDILEEVIDNAVFAEIVQAVHTSAEKGEGLHKPLMQREEFPKDVVYMISVGEESGKLAVMLHKIADFYENKVEFSVKGLLVYIEPAFISVMGVIVGVMLSSVILPMFDLVKTIQK
jgi:type IV pilus assembly protein PilC